MVSNKKGYILLIIILLLPIFSSSILLFFHAHSEMFHYRQISLGLMKESYYLEREIKKIEKRLLEKGEFCLLSETIFDLLDKPEAWWQAHACEKKFFSKKLYYFIYFLDDDPCSLTESGFTVVYYQINAYVPSLIKPFLIQSVMALPFNKPRIACQYTHPVKIGETAYFNLLD